MSRPTVESIRQGASKEKTFEQMRKERVMNLAFGEALKWSAGGVMLAGAGVALATARSTSFAKYMSVSAKTSLPVMAGLFLFALKYEHGIIYINRNPQDWGLVDDVIISGKVTKSNMPLHHRVANALYDNTFAVILCTGAPLAAAVLSQQLKLKHLTLSQRVMHSRVYAQAGILTVGLSTLAFREWMEKRGRFPEPEASSQGERSGK